MGMMTRPLPVVSLTASISVLILPGWLLLLLLLLLLGSRQRSRPGLPASPKAPCTQQLSSIMLMVVYDGVWHIEFRREPSGWPLMLDPSSIDPIDRLTLRRG